MYTKGERIFSEKNEDKAYLLYLLKKTPILGNIRLVKFIFLSNYYAYKFGLEVPFHYYFVHWHNGPYSSKITDDVEGLIISGLVCKDETEKVTKYIITVSGEQILNQLTPNLSEKKKEAIDRVYTDFFQKSTKEILDYIGEISEVKAAKFGSPIYH